MQFELLDPAWAEAVRADVVAMARAGTSDPEVEQVHVTSDLFLVIHYRISRRKLAARFPLDVDPTSGREPMSSEGLASNLFHNLHATEGGTYRDSAGYLWWGSEPDRGWSSVATDARGTDD